MRDNLEGWDGGGMGGRLKRWVMHVSVHGTGSHCCMAETNATLQSNYPLIKKLKKIPRIHIIVLLLYTFQWAHHQNLASTHHRLVLLLPSSLDLPLWEPLRCSHIYVCILVWLGFFIYFVFGSAIHLRCRLCQQDKRDLGFRYLVMVSYQISKSFSLL